MSRKVRHREPYVTSKVEELLGHKLHGWTLSVEQPPFGDDNTVPDMMAVRSGRETIAIEAKAYDNSDTVDDIRKKYLGKALTAAYVGVSENLEVALVLRYPQEVIEASALKKAIAHTEAFEYCIITKSGEGDFPASGFVKGTLTDVATALSIGASPAKHIAEAADKMADGMEVAAKWLHAASMNKPAIQAALQEILGETTFTIETCSKACLIITDAFIFQNSIAGKRVLIRQHDKLRWVFPYKLRETDEVVNHTDADAAVLAERRDERPRPLSYYDDPDNVLLRRSVMKDWRAILEINYAPIFEDAHRIVKDAFKYEPDFDPRMSARVLEKLWQTAYEICQSHLPQIHELGGEIFQRLIVDRKYVKSNYTMPESAALLSALVCPDIKCDNLRDLPKVADFACGTGSLLNGVYKQIQRLYEQKTGNNSRRIHQRMMEQKLGGIDIYPHATHLTFMTMASAHPDIPIGETRVITAKCGKTKDGTYATGSLELLDETVLFDIFEIEAEQVGGFDITPTKLNPSFPDDEMDIVIINPPFARSADQGRKTAFQSYHRSVEEKKRLQAEMAKKPTRVYDGNAGLGSAFIDVADRKLKVGGKLGYILPLKMLTGGSWKKIRQMLATEYHDVIVITLSGNDTAFSHDTSIGECMVVATKGVSGNTGRARFVCLTERPDSLLAAQTLAGHIRGMKTTRRLEDTPHGGDDIFIGDTHVGVVLNAPIAEQEWVVSRVSSISVLQTAYHLSQGILDLPPLDRIPIPMSTIGEISKVQYDNKTLVGKDIGIFDMQPYRTLQQDGYDALWQVAAAVQRSMVAKPDYKAKIRVSKERDALKILKRNSRTHFHINLGFAANSIIASWTEKPSIGVCSMPNVKLAEPKQEAAWTLWSNSTLGLLCYWMNASKQQPGRGRHGIGRVPFISTLDVRQLSDAQLKAAEDIFADLKEVRMLPYNECADDAWRHILDARLLAEVLGITDKETHIAMQELREKLCAEPSIAGTKLKKNFCNLENERKKFNLGGSKEADAKALQRERRTLETQGIYYPKL